MKISPHWAESADVISWSPPHRQYSPKWNRVCVTDVFPPPHRIAVCPAHRWLGCRRTFSGGSRTSGLPRDRSARSRRRRTSCWRSWTLPGLACEKPATCWRRCRCAWASTLVHFLRGGSDSGFVFRPTQPLTWTTNANGAWEPHQSEHYY